jgi:hypothetical protein
MTNPIAVLSHGGFRVNRRGLAALRLHQPEAAGLVLDVTEPAAVTMGSIVLADVGYTIG